MSDSTINSANQSSFQQLSSVMAKRSAQQAEDLAKTLRRQADAAQDIADRYKEKAQTLDGRADKAQVNSDALHSRLTLSEAFRQGADTLGATMARAVVKNDTYTPQGLATLAVAKVSVSGSYLDTQA